MRATDSQGIAGSAISEWARAAACRGITDLFFPDLGEREPARLRREAKARTVCASCPVLHECRDWARSHGEYGFWGGESEDDRARAGFFVELPIGRVSHLIRDIRRTRHAAGDREVS